ncbi:DUF636 domain-containing protein [Mycena vulgaris]|nr:DUF636 domain-containing protein [Mycena vulgaris]
MTTDVKRPGSCLCRKVCFTILGEPFFYAVCHCINCKKISGSAFMTNAFFRPDKVSVTAGQDLVHNYQDSDTTSGNILTRSFCSECGTSLFLSSPTKTDWISVSPASVDDPQLAWVPDDENRSDAKYPWVAELHMSPEQ